MLLPLLIGLILLLFGRTLYWAFVGLAGFLIGFELAAELLAEQAERVRLLAAVLVGIVGVLVGIFFQRVAFALGGLFAGGYLADALAEAAAAPGDPLLWFALGGVLGAIITAVIMDWAIIILSSLAGAATIVDNFDLEPTTGALLLAALTAIGILIQARRLRRPTTSPE